MKTTRNGYGLAARAAGALAFAGLFAAGVALAATTTINIGQDGPQPATLTIQWGDTVTFKNVDDAPRGVSIPRLQAASPPIPPGGSWTRVFDGRSGSYGYRQTEGRGFQGSILVELKGSVTMKATPTVVTYGRRVSFAGSALPGHLVKLEQLVAPQAGQWVERATVTAGSDGAWSTSIVPKLGARFRATAAAGQLRSPAVSIGVQPTISLTRPGGAKAGKTVLVGARISPAGAANTADLERYDSERRRWVREDRRRVALSGAVSFRWKAVKGRSQLRLQVQRYALKPGFEPVTSKPIVVIASR
jgi:plastocyanin